MMRLFFLLFIFIVPSSFATPPVSIDLSYDIESSSLHVEAIHPSFDLNKSYIRLMKVYVNGQEIEMFNYFRQEDYQKFTDDVSLVAKEGDIIKVELFATLGGTLAQEITVTDSAAVPAS